MNATMMKFIEGIGKIAPNTYSRSTKIAITKEINYLKEIAKTLDRVDKFMPDGIEIGAENIATEMNAECGFDSSYFKLENKANLRKRFDRYMKLEYPQCEGFDNWNSDWAWGKFIYILSKQEQDDAVLNIKRAKIGYLFFLMDEYKCTILDVVKYFCTFNYVRELCYNNTWGIHVVAPKSKNYPENEVIGVVKDIIFEQLAKEPMYMKELVLTMLEAAPEYSFAGKINKLIVAVEHDIDMGDTVPEFSGVWEKTVKAVSRSYSGGKRRPVHTPYVEYIAETRKDTDDVIAAINRI